MVIRILYYYILYYTIIKGIIFSFDVHNNWYILSVGVL